MAHAELDIFLAYGVGKLGHWFAKLIGIAI